MTWEVVSVVGLDNQFKQPLRTVHAYPLNDLILHALSQHCLCDPKRDSIEPNLMIHNALDGRERYETIRQDQ